MKYFSSLVSAALLAATNFLVGQAAPANSDRLAEEIRDLCEKYSVAYRAKDASTIASLFVGGRYGVMMPPNAPAAVGREAIKSRYQSFFANRGSNLTGVEKLEVGGDLADWAALEDLVVITASTNGNKYLIVVVREPDKKWKIARLMWNSNQ